MERLLEKYHPKITVDAIEKCYKGSVNAFLRGELTEEYMERLVRFTVTNSQIQQHGLDPLPSIKSMTNEHKMEKKAQISSLILPEECIEIGLNEQEYAALEGDYGTVMGISMNKTVYKALLRKCKTKIALSIRNNEKKTRAFMIKKIKEMALSQIRRQQKKQIMDSIKHLAKPNVLIKATL